MSELLLDIDPALDAAFSRYDMLARGLAGGFFSFLRTELYEAIGVPRVFGF
jgi:hypothetical protein